MYIDLDTYAEMLRAAHDPRDFSWKRTAFADGLLALITSVGAIDRAASRIDALRYPEHLSYPLGKPIYIVAAPRSGTTFLHRMMAQDPQFATFKLYQTFFPTITTNEIADRLLGKGGPVGRTIERVRTFIDEWSFGGWSGLHDMGMGQDEEDEALWALCLGTPAILLVLPYFERFGYLQYLDRMPAARRDAFIEHYRGCLQRHLFHYRGKTLLAKNVLLPGRLEIVRAAVPDARFVHVVRHPYEAIASMLSLFTMPWRWHSPKLQPDGLETRQLAQLGIDYYRTLHRESLKSGPRGEQRFVNITYEKLLEDPSARVREIYDAFELELSPQFSEQLEHDAKAQRAFKSEHRYSLEQFGLSEDEVYDELREVFDHYDFARRPEPRNALRIPRAAGPSRSPCP